MTMSISGNTNITTTPPTTATTTTTTTRRINNEGRNQIELALDINSCRVIAVAEQLAMCAQSSHHFQRIHALCLSLARGIDYGLAQNEVPSHALKLPPVLKMVCTRKNEFILQPAIMVLMISVKNACKHNWFPARDTEELLALVDEVTNNFVTRKDFNLEVCTILPTVSSVMARYYPHFKLGNVLSSLEVKPGYGIHLVDFHITKDIIIAKEEKIYLFVAMKDNIDTSSCIITPQEVNVLLNGEAVERRNRANMGSGPQLPTAVNHYLKYGINLLQVVGQFNGDYVFIIGLMSYAPSSGLLLPQDYEQPVSAASSLDSELIEGPSLVSLNCPISKTRIKTPVKGHLCKHYQCFDFTTYVEMNFKRPLWRCPSCNQSVSFTDLRVDRKMLTALEEVGEKEAEVIFSIDGSFKPASSNKHKDESHEKALANQLGGNELEESPTTLDGLGNIFDLTGEDDEMDVIDLCEPVDTKPVVHQNVQAQPPPSTIAIPPSSGSTSELIESYLAQVSNSQSPRPVLDNFLPAVFNSRPQAPGPLTANYGIDPVLTDGTSALSRQPDSSQGVNFLTNSTSNSATILQEALDSLATTNSMQFTRNFNRVSSAIQALPVQAPITSSQQHSRPSMSSPTASGPPASFQVPTGFNAQFSRSHGSNVERQQFFSQSNANSQLSNVSSVSPQNCSLSPSVQQGVRASTPTHNSYMSHTLSQPPHMRASPLPRNQNQHGVGPRAVVSNSSTSTHQSFLQPVQLLGSQTSHTKPSHTMALQTQAAIRMPASSSALNSGGSVEAVSPTEKFSTLQTEHNWRPTARMRGALSGEEYAQALSQLAPAVTPSQSPRLRPSAPLPGASRSSIEILLANRRIASELQDQSGNGTQVEGFQGVSNSTQSLN